jgi:purine-nucleoside phosphorylase
MIEPRAGAGPAVSEAAGILRHRLEVEPRVLLILGSGLGPLADAVDDARAIPFTDLPGFPPAGVAGHAGRFLGGRIEGAPVLVQQGRYHFYEGHPDAVVAAPVRLAHALGVEILVVTNAAGGIREDLEPGSLVLIHDHLNMQFRNPLRGPVQEGETRFTDMTTAYDPELRAKASRAAAALGLELHEGVYAAVPGPSFETPAEIRALGRLGADVVGMSTVPEVLVARALGMRCLGFSLVTNLAAGRSGQALNHTEVMEVGARAGHRLEAIIRALLGGLAG